MDLYLTSYNVHESRVEVSVDWSKVTGVEYAQINFNASATNQSVFNVPVYVQANHTVAPSSFKGKENVRFFLMRV